MPGQRGRGPAALPGGAVAGGVLVLFVQRRCTALVWHSWMALAAICHRSACPHGCRDGSQGGGSTGRARSGSVGRDEHGGLHALLGSPIALVACHGCTLCSACAAARAPLGALVLPLPAPTHPASPLPPPPAGKFTAGARPRGARGGRGRGDGGGGIFKKAAMEVLRLEKRLMSTGAGHACASALPGLCAGARACWLAPSSRAQRPQRPQGPLAPSAPSPAPPHPACCHLGAGEIARVALKRGLIKCTGKTPEATMASAL